MAKRMTKRATKKDIRREGMEMVNLAYEQGRFQDALDGLNLLKSIQHDTQGEWEEMIDKLILCCRNKMN